MRVLLFVAVICGGLLGGAWVSRWRERRVLPIWTWGLAFAVAWSWLIFRAGSWAWEWQLTWPGIVLLAVIAFPVGFMTCVVAAMTAGRGK